VWPGGRSPMAAGGVLPSGGWVSEGGVGARVRVRVRARVKGNKKDSSKSGFTARVVCTG